MDLSKKRRADENGSAFTAANVSGGGVGSGSSPRQPLLLDPSDARRLIEPLSPDHVLDILQSAALRHADVLDAVRSSADRDPSRRKLFIRGLGWDTTTEKLRALFSAYGDLEEAIVILDKATGKSKGYGFITFRHVDGALLALKDPSKKIDGRMTVTQLAAAGVSGPAGSAANLDGGDVSNRKIYVGNVPLDVSSDILLGHFLSYGEIEEGPLGFDKQTGKSRGFAFFVYKKEEGARASLVDPMKTIGGHQVVCKLAVDGKKGKPGGAAAPAALNDGAGDRGFMPSQPPLNSQYGGSGPNFGGGFPGGQQGLAVQNSLISGPPLSSTGGGGGYGGDMRNPYGGGGSQYGGPSGEYGGSLNNHPHGSSMYMMPPSSIGMPSGGYPDAGSYGMSGYPPPPNQPSSMPRVPSGGMYPGMPPTYY